jgi:hypothetical protein
MTLFGAGLSACGSGDAACSWRRAGNLISYPDNARLGENEKSAQQEIA